jgi:hypothetical protein
MAPSAPSIRYLLPPAADALHVNANKLYMFDSEVRPKGGFVWWEMRRVHSLTHVKCPLFRWWNIIQKPRLSLGRAALLGVSLDLDVLPSQKSCGCKRPEGFGDGAMEFVQKEYIMTTRALIFLVSDWASTMRGTESRLNMKNYLILIATLSIGTCVPAEISTTIEVAHSPCTTRSGCSKWRGIRCDHMVRVHNLLQMASSCTWALVIDVLLYLVIVNGQCSKVENMMTIVVAALAKHIDSSVTSGDCANLTTNPTKAAHPRGDVRNQRLDDTLVKHMVETVVVDKTHASAARAARALQSLPERTARQQEETYVMKYVSATAMTMKNACQVSVVCDDVRVSGEKCQLAAVWANQVHKGAWLVPQAHIQYSELCLRVP